MRKCLTAIAILCSGTLCGIYGYRAYNGIPVDAMAALIPWLLYLANEIALYGENK